VFEFSDKRNGKGYVIIDVVNLSDCTGCRLCEIGCPDIAIYIEKDSDKSAQNECGDLSIIET
jgi:2-oxoglutarate ferredoxin oxidoreductase subunit delta